jgi:acyl dehydratase
MNASTPWTIVARNLPEHARNPIHTDNGARAAGFERALVAGVTSYAYCLHPVIERYGLNWVAHGEAEVRFRSPVFDGDLVSFPVTDRADDGMDVVAAVVRRSGPLVNVSAWQRTPGNLAMSARPGEVIASAVVSLVDEYGSEYGERAGDDLDLCRTAGVVHPAVWPSLANYVFHRHVVRGSWIHTRSIVRHFGLVPVGSDAHIATTIIERFRRRGERAVADVVISVEGNVVATLEHEAIIDLSSA